MLSRCKKLQSHVQSLPSAAGRKGRKLRKGRKGRKVRKGYHIIIVAITTVEQLYLRMPSLSLLWKIHNLVALWGNIYI